MWTQVLFFSSPLNHIYCRLWMKHREIIELPVENKNQIYLLFSAGETDMMTLIHKPLPVRSCRLGKGSDNTPRHCSSTGKGMTMRPSASWGKSLMKLLSLREKEKCLLSLFLQFNGRASLWRTVWHYGLTFIASCYKPVLVQHSK